MASYYHIGRFHRINGMSRFLSAVRSGVHAFSEIKILPTAASPFHPVRFVIRSRHLQLSGRRLQMRDPQFRGLLQKAAIPGILRFRNLFRSIIFTSGGDANRSRLRHSDAACHIQRQIASVRSRQRITAFDIFLSVSGKNIIVKQSGD